MPIIKKKMISDCSTLPNELLQDSDLTYAAKGLLCDLLSRPLHAKIHKAEFVNKSTSHYEVNKLFQELKASGYLILVDRKYNGKIIERVWVVSSTPITQEEGNSYLDKHYRKFQNNDNENEDEVDENSIYGKYRNRTSVTEWENCNANENRNTCQNCLLTLGRTQNPISEITIKFATTSLETVQTKEKEERKETKQQEKKKVLQRKKEQQKKEKKEEKENHFKYAPKREAQRENNKNKPQENSQNYLLGFSAFKALYPRKQGWILAQKKWIAKKCYAQHEKIIADIKLRLQTEWANIEKQFIPLPASYLIHERWTDEEMVENKEEKSEKQNDFNW